MLEHEIIVCNNAPDDVKARSVEGIVKYYVAKEPKRWHLAREPLPGKSRALNKIIPLSRGQILGFLDDDVEVNSSWLQATCNFFAHHSFDVMQGSILVPPEMAGDEKFLKLLNRYRTNLLLSEAWIGSQGDPHSQCSQYRVQTRTS